jgi:pyruvate kinase
MRRAKIVCTLGPSTAGYDRVRDLVVAGMDVARLNLSHGEHADHLAAYNDVRRAGDEVGRGVGVLADLQGPKIRLGRFAEGPVEVARDDVFTITVDDVAGTRDLCSTTYADLAHDVAVGDLILIDDGRVTVRVEEVSGPNVVTRVIEGGRLSDHKGLNLPSAAVSAPALTAKDEADLRWALRTGVDMVALSFVRSPTDIDPVLRIMDSEGRRVPVLAKLEKPQAIANLEQIVDAFNGIMVARGDLGVEMHLEEVPLLQKRAIDMCRRASKPVIVATQMLESMMTASRPTRAEVSDVANAVLDGTDALMLSGETSVGVDPARVVATMARIITHVESKALDQISTTQPDPAGSTARALTRAAVGVGHEVEARFLIAFTETGSTARLISRHRSRIPLLAFTPDPAVRSWLSVVWGVETFMAPRVTHTDELVQHVDTALRAIGRVDVGERVVVVAGVPPGVPGTTNGMRVHTVGFWG